MSDSVAHRCPTELGGILCRFLDLENVVESPLLNKIYYGGLAMIGLLAVAGLVKSLGMAMDQPGGGAVGFFVVAAMVGFGTVIWRFGCEVAFVLLNVNPLRNPAPPGS